MPPTSLPPPDRLVTAVRAALPEAQAIYLHGSHARGHARPDSDLDLAVLLPPGPAPAPLAWLDALAAASDAAGRVADLADLRRASTVLAAEVLRHGRRLWSDGTLAADLFETHALSDYGRLREERAALERRIAETGVIYG